MAPSGRSSMFYKMTDPKERTDQMTSDSCRRCSRHFFVGGESQPMFGVTAAQKGIEPRQRAREIRAWGDSLLKQSGPYCRSCAYDRKQELHAQDRRSQKRLDAKRYVQNVERDDCTLIAMMKATGRAYSAVQKAARKVGYRPGKGGTDIFQQRQMANYLGFEMVPVMDRANVSLGDMISGRAPKLTAARLIEQLKLAGISGTVYCRTIGHAFPIDLDTGEVFNATSRTVVIDAYKISKTTIVTGD